MVIHLEVQKDVTDANNEIRNGDYELQTQLPCIQKLALHHTATAKLSQKTKRAGG
jgi:hypothetical protein